jgi:hypothetical protein
MKTTLVATLLLCAVICAAAARSAEEAGSDGTIYPGSGVAHSRKLKTISCNYSTSTTTTCYSPYYAYCCITTQDDGTPCYPIAYDGASCPSSAPYPACCVRT